MLQVISILPSSHLTLSYLEGPPPVFLHHPKTAKGIKMKLSDSKDTPLRHFLHVKPVHYIFSCCHGIKIKVR